MKGLSTVVISFVVLGVLASPPAAQAQEGSANEPIRVYVLPFEGTRDVVSALQFGQRFFESRLSESGLFRFAGTQDMEVVYATCADSMGVSAENARECQLQAARRSYVRWVFEVTMEEASRDNYVVTLDVWNPDENQKDFTVTHLVEADEETDAAREGLVELANRFLASPLVGYRTGGSATRPGGSPGSGPRAGDGRIEIIDIQPQPARLVVNGQDFGIVPGQHFGLPTGEVTVELRADGYQTMARTITLQAGQLEELRGVRLEPLPATLFVDCNIEGATVKVDGQTVGNTVGGQPVSFEVPASATGVEISREGYQPFTASLTLIPGGQQRFDVELSTRPPDPRNVALHGTFSLAPGFGTRGAEGVSGSTQRAPSNCSGHVSESPSHIFTLSESFSSLTFYLTESAGDTTMVLEGPGGQIWCDDDSGGNLWPLLQGAFAAGEYRLWIGSWTQGTNHAYRLEVTDAVREVAPIEPDVPTDNGAITLSRNFYYHTGYGVSQATRPAPSQCAGHIGQTPNHVLTLNDRMDSLALTLTYSAGDTTMVVEGPGGQVWCDDDSGEGLWPLIQGSFARGEYRIYIGSYSQGNAFDYTLAISEAGWTVDSDYDGIPDDVDACIYEPENYNGYADHDGCPDEAPTAGSQYTYSCNEATYDCVAISSGFLPDPVVVSGTSGGTHAAPSSCSGWIYGPPDHVLTLNSYFSHLKIWVTAADGDTTLIVDGPGGVRCNDDFSGLNPGLNGAWQPGTYRVWVGSYSSGAYHSYTLNFTEYR